MKVLTLFVILVGLLIILIGARGTYNQIWDHFFGQALVPVTPGGGAGGSFGSTTQGTTNQTNTAANGTKGQVP